MQEPVQSNPGVFPPSFIFLRPRRKEFVFGSVDRHPGADHPACLDHRGFGTTSPPELLKRV